tara:strand:- start:69 stop:701 length:633 start_codon:yes stop_codon:yes gene_type:complete
LTLKEYFQINKSRIKVFLKFSILIFTVIGEVIVLLLYFFKNNNENPFMTSVGCFIFGIVLSLFICSVGFFVGYNKSKWIYNLFNNTPKPIRDSLELKIVHSKNNSKYDFIEFQIVSMSNETKILLEFDLTNKNVLLTVPFNIHELNINDFALYFNKKYNADNIYFTGFGIRKLIKFKQYIKLNENDFNTIINEINIFIKKCDFENHYANN